MEGKKEVTNYSSREKEIFHAEFHKLLKLYMFLSGLWAQLITVVFIPLIPFWVLGIGPWYVSRYYRRLRCVLRERSLYFRKGFIIRSESTVPLDRITDITVKEGPILRLLGLSRIRVETPGTTGQSVGAGGITLTGIINSPKFRDRVFAQRDLIILGKSKPGTMGDDFSELVTLVGDIRDSVRRMEEHVLSEEQ